MTRSRLRSPGAVAPLSMSNFPSCSASSTPSHPSQPEDARRSAVDLVDQLAHFHGRFDAVVAVEAQVAVSPVERPRPRGLGVAQPGDRQATPLRTEVGPLRRSALDNRQVGGVDLALNSNLVTRVLRDACRAPALHPVQRRAPANHLQTPWPESRLLATAAVRDGWQDAGR